MHSKLRKIIIVFFQLTQLKKHEFLTKIAKPIDLVYREGGTD